MRALRDDMIWPGMTEDLIDLIKTYGLNLQLGGDAFQEVVERIDLLLRCT